MALFERLKQGLSFDSQRSNRNNTAGPAGATEGSIVPSVRGETRLMEMEKRDRVTQLTSGEYELYLLLLEGYTLNESAKQLSVKYSTANTHMGTIYRKLGVRSRAELIINYHTTVQ